MDGRDGGAELPVEGRAGRGEVAAFNRKLREKMGGVEPGVRRDPCEDTEPG